jgi:adenosylmethionine-8-amino-7-oxononanoate aminotransferase
MATPGQSDPARYDPELLRRVILDFRQMQTFAEDPFIITRGEGVYLWDDRGRRYFDGLSGVFVAGLGHGNRRVIAAIAAQLEQLAFAPPLHGTTPAALEFARALLAFAPAPFRDGAVKLLSGGSEATEAAMKLARQYHVQSGHPRKYKIIARYGSYHGATMGALSASGGWERKSVFEPLGTGFLHVHPPDCRACPFGHSLDACRARPEALFTCARLVERTIEAEDPDTVAAVIMEPMSVSSAGFTVPPPEFFHLLREVCNRHQVLLIFDEIITGFGRLGTPFGADYYGVMPDLLCCGKGLSGGYAPLAAVLVQPHVYAAFLGRPEERREFHHGHTYGGNPVAAAAGLAALQELQERCLIAHVAALAPHLTARLQQFAARFPGVRNVRGAGFLQGFDLDPAVCGPRPGARFECLARRRGLLARCGRDFVVFAPPLVTTRAELDAMLDIAEACLDELHR